MKIVVDNKIPFLKGVLEPFGEVIYMPGIEISQDEIKDADALIIRTRTKCNARLLEGSTVKFIATATIGFDHIDTEYCNRNGIKWVNAPGCNSGSVMQYIASALAFLSDKYRFSFTDKTLGVVGVGNVGSKVAQMASTLGMNVLLNDPPRERKEGKEKFVTLSEIQKKADIITFHVPLNLSGKDKTIHLFNDDFMDKTKPDAIIINSSRGKVVSGNSLKKGLLNKKINAAILDVWENEPQIDRELLKLIDIGTPHIAGYSADGKALGTAMSVQALSRFFGLNLDNWFPENIPTVPDNKFKLNCGNLSSDEIFKWAILATYNIKNDDLRLRKSPEKFEYQRENYPVRREFKTYSPKLINCNEKIVAKLSLLGFNV